MSTHNSILTNLFILTKKGDWIPVKKIYSNIFEKTYEFVWKTLMNCKGLGIMIKDHDFEREFISKNIITQILFVDSRREYTIGICLQRKTYGKNSFIVYGIQHPQDSDKGLLSADISSIIRFCPKEITKQFICYP